jgi:hypothetical protein
MAKFWYPAATKWTPSLAVTPLRSVILVLVFAEVAQVVVQQASRTLKLVTPAATRVFIRSLLCCKKPGSKFLL